MTHSFALPTDAQMRKAYEACSTHKDFADQAGELVTDWLLADRPEITDDLQAEYFANHVYEYGIDHGHI